MTQRGTDWSNYQVVPTEDAVASLKGAGVGDFAVVGLQDSDHAERQAEALRAGGIPVEDCYFENTREPRLFGGLLRAWIAVEEHSGYEDEDAIDAGIRYAEDHGLVAGICSRSTYIADSALADLFAEGGKYADLPRWFARYDGDPEGAHDGLAMVQYEGGAQLPGIRYPLDLDARAWGEDAEADTAVQGDSAESAPPADGTQQQGNADARQGGAPDVLTDEEAGEVRVLVEREHGTLTRLPDDAANPDQVRYLLAFTREGIDALHSNG